MYLPQTAISDGALFLFGFSTISSISIKFLLIFPGFITPYLWIWLESILFTATTEFLVWKYASLNSFMHGTSETNKSSGRITAKGSSIT